MPLLLGFTASESGCLLRKRRSEFTCCSGTFSASPSSQRHQLKQARAPSTIIQLARLACVISYWPGIDGEQQLSERGGQITFTVGILCAALLCYVYLSRVIIAALLSLPGNRIDLYTGCYCSTRSWTTLEILVQSRHSDEMGTRDSPSWNRRAKRHSHLLYNS